MTVRGPRYEAKQQGKLTYWTGKPCKRGHVDFRRTDNGNCCECDRINAREQGRREYHRDHPTRGSAAAIAYRAANLDKVQTRLRRWAKRKRETDPQFALRERIYNHTNYAVRHANQRNQRRLMVGCLGTYFRRWLEAQFEPGMTWSNYPEVWTVDHVKPLSTFDLTDPQQFLKACHFSNTRPMFRADNIKRRIIRRPTA